MHNLFWELYGNIIFFMMGIFAIIIFWFLVYKNSDDTVKLYHEKYFTSDFKKKVLNYVLYSVLALAVLLGIVGFLKLTDVSVRKVENMVIEQHKTTKPNQQCQNATITSEDLLNRVDNNAKDLLDIYIAPMGAILSFLAVMMIIKIEMDRLDNERRHNRRKAIENIRDSATYAIEMLKQYDDQYIDFYIGVSDVWRDEDRKSFINDLTPNLYYNKYFFHNDVAGKDTHYVSQEFIYLLHISQMFKEHDDDFKQRLEFYFHKSVLSIFDDIYQRVSHQGYKDIGDEYKKVLERLEELFYKEDFDVNKLAGNYVLKSFLSIQKQSIDYFQIKTSAVKRSENKRASKDTEEKYKNIASSITGSSDDGSKDFKGSKTNDVIADVEQYKNTPEIEKDPTNEIEAIEAAFKYFEKHLRAKNVSQAQKVFQILMILKAGFSDQQKSKFKELISTLESIINSGSSHSSVIDEKTKDEQEIVEAHSIKGMLIHLAKSIKEDKREDFYRALDEIIKQEPILLLNEYHLTYYQAYGIYSVLTVLRTSRKEVIFDVLRKLYENHYKETEVCCTSSRKTDVKKDDSTVPIEDSKSMDIEELSLIGLSLLHDLYHRVFSYYQYFGLLKSLQELEHQISLLEDGIKDEKFKIMADKDRFYGYGKQSNKLENSCYRNDQYPFYQIIINDVVVNYLSSVERDEYFENLLEEIITSNRHSDYAYFLSDLLIHIKNIYIISDKFQMLYNKLKKIEEETLKYKFVRAFGESINQ